MPPPYRSVLPLLEAAVIVVLFLAAGCISAPAPLPPGQSGNVTLTFITEEHPP